MGSYIQQREQYLGKVLSLHKSGMKAPAISKIVPVSRETLSRWIRKFGSEIQTETCKETAQPSHCRNELKEKYYDEVIRLHFEEGYGEGRIEKALPIGHTTASRWIANFVAENGNQYKPLMKGKQSSEASHGTSQNADVKQLQAEIDRLQSELKQQKMRADAYDMMIDLAEQKFQIPIRKKSGAKR